MAEVLKMGISSSRNTYTHEMEIFVGGKKNYGFLLIASN